MTALDRGAAPRKLYEYRGNAGTRAAAPPQESTDTLAQENATVCTWCSGSVEKVVGGWWCGACESAVV
jgi:hypothetical protein